MNNENRNKIIAEFMGLSSSDFDGFIIDGIPYHKKQLKYDTSWDWLMAVIDKIEKEIDVFEIKSYTTLDGKVYEVYCSKIYNTIGFKSKLKTTYNAVIKLINWHNENTI